MEENENKIHCLMKRESSEMVPKATKYLLKFCRQNPTFCRLDKIALHNPQLQVSHLWVFKPFETCMGVKYFQFWWYCLPYFPLQNLTVSIFKAS